MESLKQKCWTWEIWNPFEILSAIPKKKISKEQEKINMINMMLVVFGNIYYYKFYYYLFMYTLKEPVNSVMSMNIVQYTYIFQFYHLPS